MPRTNEANWDRILRAVAGVALLWVAFMSGLLASPWSWVAGVVGLVMLVTAAVGFCPAYALMGLNTCPMTDRT